jgi:hypothetical protein
MSERSSTIQCNEHGSAYETFICEHLLKDPQQLWCSREPTAENPWPDAWCQQCDKEFQRFGEWNEENEDKVPIKLICHHCYLKRRALGLPWE